MEGLGELEIIVVEATNLMAKDINGKSDPYVEWTFNGEKYKTNFLEANLNPVWNDSYLYDVSIQQMPPFIEFMVYDYDKVGEDDFIGCCEFDMQNIATHPIDAWVPLKNHPSYKEKKNKKIKKGRGNIHIKISFTSPLVILNKLFNCDDLLFLRTLCQTVINEELATSIVAIGNNMQLILPIIQALISDEVHREKQVTSLFRTDCMSTKIMRIFSNVFGFNWLKLMIGDIVKDIATNPGSFEIDPNKVTPADNVVQNLENLRNNVLRIIESVLSKLDNCPNEIRIVCRFIREEVEQKFQGAGLTSVNGFIFLRFICPAILSPTASKLLEGELNPNAQRHLLLLAKVIQNMANQVEFGQKEEYMTPFNPLVTEYIPKVQHFLEELSIGTSINFVEPISIDNEELSCEIDNVFEIFNTNATQMEQHLPDDPVVRNEFNSLRSSISNYCDIINRPRKEIKKKRRCFLFG